MSRSHVDIDTHIRTNPLHHSTWCRPSTPVLSYLPRQECEFRSYLLLQLPVELLDSIASFVPTHCDLVPLALTCHSLAHMVISAHAAYRTIRIHSQRGPAP
ncbi:hypothetical protein EDB92DRAFT_2094502 [Lactarius akahatsu]|uniref:F-box domain-containing protein n=1 Tax=Lactarius akahatsu TaxID=416441 RepID=A0AAD4L923_9AGAM|nr:hypothetical protein EDB92DRAFT_2094502 [Lactarius akahatsu]